MTTGILKNFRGQLTNVIRSHGATPADRALALRALEALEGVVGGDADDKVKKERGAKTRRRSK